MKGTVGRLQLLCNQVFNVRRTHAIIQFHLEIIREEKLSEMVTTIIAIFVERKLARVLKIAKNRLHANLYLFHHFCEFLHNEKMLTPPTNALYHYPNGMGTFLQM